MKLLLTLILLIKLSCALAQDNKGYITVSAEYGYGYFWSWDNSVAEETNIRLAGQYLLSTTDEFGYSTRLALSRHSKNDKLAYGIGYYYYSASGHYDGTYTKVSTSLPKAQLLDYSISESGHTALIYLAPTLWNSDKWLISSAVTTGFIWLSLSEVVIPIDDRPIILEDRTARNAGFLGGYLAISASASYAINPYFRLFSRFRWNFQWDVGATLLLEPTVGIEIPLVASGRRFTKKLK